MEVRPGYKQTDIGVIPEDWETARLPSVVWYQEGPGVRNYQFTSAGVKLFNGTNIEDGRICLDNTRRYISEREAYGSYSHFLADAGDIVIACSGITVSRFDEKVGVLSREHLPLCMNTSTMRFKIASPRLEKDYFRHFLKSQVFKKQIAGTATGSAQLNFGPAHVSTASVPLPARAEQQAIAEALSDADALIECLEQLLTKKRQLKQGAMQNLLTGKKRLPGVSGQWRTCPLGDVVAHCSSGGTPYRGRPEYYRGTVKWITSGELNYNVITDTLEHISEEAMRRTNLTMHPAGTFLMAITGLEAEGTRGACGIVGSPATTNQSCMAIYPSPELKTEYLYHYYVLRGNALALKYCQGTKQQSYTAKLVKLLPIDLPPTVAEQTAIAAILSDMDAEIGALEAKLAKTRRLKQGMMQELLTGRVRLT